MNSNFIGVAANCSYFYYSKINSAAKSQQKYSTENNAIGTAAGY